MQNPFIITFGRKPLEMIERFPQKHEILEGFTSENANRQLYIITGIRGSGKTVLMTTIAETLRSDQNWIVVELNPETDLIKGLAAKLANHPVCLDWISRAKLNLSFLGLGVEISGVSPITDMETAVIRMLQLVKKHNKRLLVTIDEATNSRDMRIFSASFQIFVRQELPIFLLMTGLYENIYELQNEKSLTFLYRAPKIYLASLDPVEIRNRFQAIFRLNHDDAVEMASLTGGYPFAFQLLGYLTWNRGGDFRAAQEEYRQYLYEFVYNKIWEELSPKDRKVLSGIAGTRSSSKEVKETLRMTDNELNPYRQRLIRTGLVDGSERGVLKLTLPLFDLFIRDRMAFE